LSFFRDSPVSFLFLLLVPVWANTRFAPTDIHLSFAFPVSRLSCTLRTFFPSPFLPSPVSLSSAFPAHCALRTENFFPCLPSPCLPPFLRTAPCVLRTFFPVPRLPIFRLPCALRPAYCALSSPIILCKHS
jgi:hypothetical protein